MHLLIISIITHRKENYSVWEDSHLITLFYMYFDLYYSHLKPITLSPTLHSIRFGFMRRKSHLYNINNT